MSQFNGRLEFRDIGSGTWLLHTDSGQTLQLTGSVPSGLAGKRVEVTGRRAQLHGFGMSGDDGGLEVRSVRAI